MSRGSRVTLGRLGTGLSLAGKPVDGARGPSAGTRGVLVVAPDFLTKFSEAHCVGGDQTRPDRAGSDRIGPDWMGSDRAVPGRDVRGGPAVGGAPPRVRPLSQSQPGVGDRSGAVLRPGARGPGRGRRRRPRAPAGPSAELDFSKSRPGDDRRTRGGATRPGLLHLPRVRCPTQLPAPPTLLRVDQMALGVPWGAPPPFAGSWSGVWGQWPGHGPTRSRGPVARPRQMAWLFCPLKGALFVAR